MDNLQNINTLFSTLDTKIERKDYFTQELTEWENKIETQLKLIPNLEEARVIIQTASQITQQKLSEKISSIVTKALAAVFPEDPYTFKIQFEKRRNVTECDLYFERNGKYRTPLASCGYGVADIASLALRVSYWKLDGDSRPVLILDEPTRNLDKNAQKLASMMIKNLSKIGLQFIIVTHNPELTDSADRCFEVQQENGRSFLTQIIKEEM